MKERRRDTESPRHLSRAERQALAHELPADLRRLRHRTLVDTLAAGVPVRADAVTIVLSALDETLEAPLRVTRTAVEELLWFGVGAFCAGHGIAVPAGAAAALHAALAVAVADRLLDPESDSPADIFAPFSEITVANTSFSSR